MPGVVTATVARKETTSRSSKDNEPAAAGSGKLKPTSSKSNLQTNTPEPAEVKDKEAATESFGQLTGDLIALFQKHEFLQETSLAGLGHQHHKARAGGDDRDEFIVKFDSLIKRVAWSKRQTNSSIFLLSFFNQTNVRILQFYEMLATILNVCASWAELMMPSSSQQSGHHQAFLAKTLEFLHLLTTNTNEDQEDDECTITCCSFLARSYNFTSALARLILSHFNGAQSPVSSVAKGVAKVHLVDDKVVYIAFGVLNRLAYDHKLFAVDSYVEQLVQLAVDKIIHKESKNMYFQFISNALRNNGPEIERLVKNSDDYKQLGRQLSFIIIERNLNPNLIINVLIILLKLYPEQTYGILTGGQPSSDGHLTSTTTTLSYENKRKIYDSFDLAMRVLTRNTAETGRPAEASEQTNSRLNALNLIYELLKHSNVKQLFESNEDYSNVTLFKLNQLLIENDDASLHSPSGEEADEEMTDADSALSPSAADSADGAKKPPKSFVRLPTSTFSIKVFRIFNELATSSSRLASKLFKMVFVTKQFIENCLNENDKIDEGVGGSQNKLTKKLQLLFLTSAKSKSNKQSSTINQQQRKKKQSTSELDEQYNTLFDHHLKLCKLARTAGDVAMVTDGGDEQSPATGDAKRFKLMDEHEFVAASEMTSQKRMLMCLYEYLYNLFKKMLSVRENFYGTERNMNKFVGLLAENFSHLYSMFHLSSTSHKLKSSSTATSTSTCPADLCQQDEYEFSSKVFFYNLGIIHALTRRFTITLLDRKKLANQAFDLLRQNTWMPTQTLISTDICLSNAGNFMTTIRLLISFLFADNASKRSNGTASSDLDGYSANSANGSEEDLLRNSVLSHLKSESLLKIVSQVVHQSNRKELVALAYELLFDLASLSKTENLNFSFESFAALGQCFVSQSSAHDDLSELKAPPSSMNAGDLMAKLNSAPGLNPASMPANSALAKLFEHFNYKTSEQKKQEAKMINLLNSYFTNSLNHEIEMRVFKDQLLEFAQREAQLKQEISSREAKIGELKKLAEQHLSEMKSLREQYNEQKKDLLQMEKDHAGGIQKLERALSSEVKSKLEMQKTYEAKNKELEQSVEKLEAELKAKTAEHESLRNETEKLKSILSYVKENFK